MISPNLLWRDAAESCLRCRTADGLTQHFQIESFLANSEIIVQKGDRDRRHRSQQNGDNAIENLVD